MVGTTLDGELKPAPASTGAVRFALATRDDNAAIRRLLRENPMRGAITLTFEREPDYFLGSNLANGIDQVIVAFDADRLVCMGRSTTREAWVNGRVRRVRYLAELRLDARAQGRFDILRGGYAFFRRLQREYPADFCYTSIATDNMRARRLLERGLPGFPRYESIGNLTTLLFSTRRSVFSRSEIARGSSAEHVRATFEGTGSRPDWHELAESFDRANPRHQLSAAWTEARMRSLAAHDLHDEDFHVVRKHGAIIAVGALWDQRRFRQTVVRDYSPMLRVARPFLNTIGAVFGMPRLPARGCALPYAVLSPLAIAHDAHSALPDLVAGFCQQARRRNIEYLALGLPANDARLPELRRRFRGRTYETRLYRVRWPEEPELALDGRPVLPDIALL